MIDAIYTALRDHLISDSALTDALGGAFVYAGIAPPDVPPPYIVMRLDSGVQRHLTAWPSLDMTVTVTCVTHDGAQAGMLADLTRESLDAAMLDLGATWGEGRCQHLTPFHTYELIDRRPYVYAGGVYRLCRQTGAAAYIAFQDVDLSPRCIQFDPGLREDFTEMTAGVDAVRWYMPTVRRAAPKLRGAYDAITATGTAILAALTEGAEGTLVWGPAGTAAGNPKWGILARVSRFNVTATYDGEAEFEVEWINRQGTFVYDGRTAVW